ncbi:MAG TPA: hypothetical protein VNE63_12915, partial [Candidatus Acidoferrales bacterium]|nr:hypothetical protein [Candidatus Acidoferrales bacterium]
MPTSSRRITRRDCVAAFLGFMAGLVCLSGLVVARHHTRRIEGMLRMLGPVHAAEASPSINGRQL